MVSIIVEIAESVAVLDCITEPFCGVLINEYFSAEPHAHQTWLYQTDISPNRAEPMDHAMTVPWTDIGPNRAGPSSDRPMDRISFVARKNNINHCHYCIACTQTLFQFSRKIISQFKSNRNGDIVDNIFLTCYLLKKMVTNIIYDPYRIILLLR